MNKQDKWKHYKVHKQAIGTPINGKMVWTKVWEVTRPWGHSDMQGDDWEKRACRKFDTFEQALHWALKEAAKDELMYECEKAIEVVREAIERV